MCFGGGLKSKNRMRLVGWDVCGMGSECVFGGEECISSGN